MASPAEPVWKTSLPGLALALLCLLPLLAPETMPALLEYRRDAVLDGQVWRLWSGHFSHYTGAHALLDAAACLGLATALRRLGGCRGLAARLLLIAPLLTLLLLLALPDMSHYRGASGLAMVLAAALLATLWRAHHAWRPAIGLAGALLVGKIAADALGLSPAPSSLPADVRVAWEVHAAGFGAGLLAWWRGAGHRQRARGQTRQHS